MNWLKSLVKELEVRRYDIIKTHEFLKENWDPTYGQQDPTTETVEVVDFDELLRVIDEFADTFKEKFK